MWLCPLEGQTGFTPVRKREGSAFRELKAAKKWSCLIPKHEGRPGEPHTKAQLAACQARKGQSY